MKIKKIGINIIEISDIKIGKGQKEGLNLDSIKIKYSLLGLFNRQVKNISLNGISLNLEYENNHLSIAGLEGLLKNENNKAEKNNTSSTPFTIKKMLVSDSIVSLKINDKNLSFPFDLATTSFNQYMLPKEFNLGIYPSGHEITARGKVGIDNKIKVDLKTNELPLHFFKDIINEVIPIDFKGNADIRASANISPKLAFISDISASFKLDNTSINYSGIILKNPNPLESSEQPIDISITSKDIAHWEYETSSFFSDYATLPIILKLSGTANLFEGSQKAKVKAITKLMTNEEAQAIQWDISLDRDNSIESLKVQVNGKAITKGNSSPSFTTLYNNMVFTTLSPEFHAEVEYNKGEFSGSYLFKLKNIEANLDKMNFSAPVFSIKGDIRQEKDNRSSYLSSFLIDGKSILFKDSDTSANIPDYLVKGLMQYDPVKGFNVKGQTLFEKGAISMPDEQLSLKGITGELPVIWPFDENLRYGKLSVDRIRYKDYSIRPLNFVISLKGNKISFKGNALYPLFPGMDIRLFGNTALDSPFTNGKINIDIPEYIPDSKIEMGKIVPELKGYVFKGKLKTDAYVNFTKTKLESGLNLAIDEGNISNIEENLSLENISLNLKLNDLINIISPSGQRLKIDKITFNKILANDFIVDFTLDGSSSLLIEHGSFKWCDGDINIPSFKIVPGKDDYELTLLCDRLDLTKVLAQLGAVNATGEGTLNGKIPLHYSTGHIIFKNGFLSSIPGQGGKIKIKNTEILTNAIEQETKESAQIEIVAEALKDFIYDTVKIDLNSDGDDLKMKLYLYGKPVNNLPFEYSDNLGRFIRVDSTKNGSTFKGFGIDLNFSIPFDELLNYGDALDMIE
ncbi:MAG: YdbH domain-containing protein [Desulfobacteraceae bacterium]